jgi:anti-anti-sigma factor
MQTDRRGQPGDEWPERPDIVPPKFELVAREEGGSLAVALLGELDMAATFKLEAELERLFARHEFRRLVFDLADLKFVDSAGLGALLAIRDRTQDLGIEFILANPSDPVQRILALSGTGDVLMD